MGQNCSTLKQFTWDVNMFAAPSDLFLNAARGLSYAMNGRMSGTGDMIILHRVPHLLSLIGSAVVSHTSFCCVVVAVFVLLLLHSSRSDCELSNNDHYFALISFKSYIRTSASL